MTDADHLFASAYAAGLDSPLGWGILADFQDEAGEFESARLCRTLHLYAAGNYVGGPTPHYFALGHPASRVGVCLFLKWVRDAHPQPHWDHPRVAHALRLAARLAVGLPVAAAEAKAAGDKAARTRRGVADAYTRPASDDMVAWAASRSVTAAGEEELGRAVGTGETAAVFARREMMGVREDEDDDGSYRTGRVAAGVLAAVRAIYDALPPA
jgi:hypothetical protein